MTTTKVPETSEAFMAWLQKQPADRVFGATQYFVNASRTCCPIGTFALEELHMWSGYMDIDEYSFLAFPNPDSDIMENIQDCPEWASRFQSLWLDYCKKDDYHFNNITAQDALAVVQEVVQHVHV